jgi:hypothetical protein
MERGRFAPGNRFASGNPNHKRMYKLRRAMLTAVDDAAMERITKKLVELAEGGDLEAVKILFSYAVGRPPQAIELSSSDTPHPLNGVSEEEAKARIERVNARIAEFDKQQRVKLEDFWRTMQDGPPKGNEKPPPR